MFVSEVTVDSIDCPSSTALAFPRRSVIGTATGASMVYTQGDVESAEMSVGDGAAVFSGGSTEVAFVSGGGFSASASGGSRALTIDLNAPSALSFVRRRVMSWSKRL